jgi:hypothetical protein
MPARAGLKDAGGDGKGRLAVITLRREVQSAWSSNLLLVYGKGQEGRGCGPGRARPLRLWGVSLWPSVRAGGGARPLRLSGVSLALGAGRGEAGPYGCGVSLWASVRAGASPAPAAVGCLFGPRCGPVAEPGPCGCEGCLFGPRCGPGGARPLRLSGVSLGLGAGRWRSPAPAAVGGVSLALGAGRGEPGPCGCGGVSLGRGAGRGEPVGASKGTIRPARPVTAIGSPPAP